MSDPVVIRAVGPVGPVGPRGPEGPQGLPGQAGQDGKDGIRGPKGTDGPSAYQVAVADGYRGTEAEWLDSLVGERGEKGPKGDKGPQGPPGFSRGGGGGAALGTAIPLIEAGAGAVGTAVAASHEDHVHPASGGSGSHVDLIVAAVDASAAAKAAADYTCDGTADEVQINAALAALPAAGGIVQLSEGTFTLANTVTWSADNVTLQGSGRATRVKITAAVAGLHIINAVGASEAAPLVAPVVCDLKVQGYGDAGSGGATVHGIRFKWAKAGRIENVWTQDVTWAGVSLDDSWKCTVQAVVIERGTLGTNGGWYGVSVQNTASTNKSTGHVIADVIADVIEHGLGINASNDLAATNITCVNPRADYAINLTACNRVVVDGFAIIGGHGAVFVEQASDRCRVANGVLQAAATAHTMNGVFVSASTNIDVVNIDLDMTGQTSGNGVRVDATSHSVSLVNVKARNAVTRGIYVENGANYPLVQNCLATGTTGGPGIQIGTGTKARVIGNYAIGNSTDGLQLACTRSQVFGNVSDTNGGAGIFAQYVDDSVIANNVCHGNTGYGIDQGNAAANSERNLIVGNQLSGNTAGVIRVSTASGANANRFRINTPSTSDNGTTADLTDSTDRRYLTDAQQTVVSNTSGTNTGDRNEASINFVIDGGGSAISTGIKGDVRVDFACVVNSWTLLADQSGAIVIDVWKDTLANFPPADADAMPGAGKEPTIAASGTNATDTTITDWTTDDIAAGDILRFNVDSCATITRCTLSLKVTRV